MNIPVQISQKIAMVCDSARLVCGNSDYTITFTFDAEWDAYTAKTARFVYCRNGVTMHQDVLFEGDTVAVPVLRNVYEVAVGVYAGDLHTTTPARIPCIPSITCAEDTQDVPSESIYNQLLEYLANLQHGGTGSIGTGTCRSHALQASAIGIAEQEEIA